MKNTFTYFLEQSVPLFWVRRVLSIVTLVFSFSGSTLAQGCPPLSTLPCDQLLVSLPYNLHFSGSVVGTETDQNGVGTGFTIVSAYSGTRPAEDGTPSNTSVPGYEVSKLTVNSGNLQVVTNQGTALLDNNNQLNALGVQADSRSRLTMGVTLVNPYNGSSLGGLWFGLHDKTFVELVVVENKVQLRREFNDVSLSSDQHTTGTISNLDTSPVRLRLVSDPMTSTVAGFYSLNGGVEQSVGEALSISDMGLTSSTAYAGLFANHYNGTSPVTYTFDDFSITPEGTSKPTALVSNVVATTGRSYTLAELAVGVNHYTDRTFQVTSAPAFLSGVSLIRTANDDKKNTSSTVLSFNLSKTATVYVAYDPRATALPSWLSGWQKLPDRIGVNDSKISYMELYSKSYPAGTVTLGGNMVSPAAGAQNNYFVLAKGTSTTSNQPPVANAGPDKTITLPTNSVALDGSGTDADGTISGYSWSQVSGPGLASFSSTSVARPTVSGLLAGSYVFSLVVRDDQNTLSAADQVTVTVNSAPTTTNQPPVANAGPDKTISLPTNSVALDGSGTDADGTISGYSWSQVSGPGLASFSSTTVARPTVSGLLAGSYVFSLVVRDDQNALSAADQVTVTVLQSTQTSTGCPPLSTLPCDQLQVSLPYSLSFSGSVAGTLADKNGAGTGFTLVDPYSGTRLSADGPPSNTSVPGYEPSKLTVTSGRLQVVTNKGIAWLGNNNQLNTLGVKVGSRSRLTVEVMLVNPYNGTSAQQGGLWLGLSDKTYVKLVVVGDKVEMRREVNDASSTAEQRITGRISSLNTSTVKLRLVVDPVTDTVVGSYSLNGGAEQSMGTAMSISGIGLTSSTTYAGLFATHRNGDSPITYTFDNFSVTGVTTADLLRPYVTAVRPANGATGVALDESVSVDLAFPSGASLDGSTVNSNTVKLYKVVNGSKTAVTGATAVNATAAGDAITFTAALSLSTTYEFVITDQVKDLNGYAILPFTSSFTTTNFVETIPADLEGVSFTEQILIDKTFGSDGFTTLVVGPDRRLYAATSGGKIERWDIKTDGTLENRVTIAPFGTSRRLLVGLRFDPAATPGNLIAWMSHSAPEFLNAPDWSSKVSKINLNNPTSPQVVDYVINLPRSYKDHSIFSMDFGPDGALYFLQGSNTAMGSPDAAWGNRPERLLSAAVLRLNIALAEQQALPINAKTEEEGFYNPYATNAPLTLYATGLRNAYDLVWHTNGQLYVPTNGSAAGGNIPALSSGSVWSNGSVYTGPDIPAMTDVRATQGDYLFRVVKGGYYGHPNVLRNEYIMNGGNPTSGVDPGEIVWTLNDQVYGYPVGTPKEPNYRGWAFDFGLNKSPNGIIEYKSNAFGGKLTGKLLVCRFSGGDDILLLEPGGTKLDIIRSVEGSLIPGFRRPFANPLDVIEDPMTGNLYLSEYFDGNGDGQPRITLLRASEPAIASLINAGGKSYTDSQSRKWGGDAYYSSGIASSKSFDVAGTTDDPLYLKYRYASSTGSTTPGSPFSYNIPVSASGYYTVKLHFLEPFYGAPGGKTSGLTGARVFNVDIEGQRVLSNYDIYSQDGAGKAIVKIFENISVTDRFLNITFTSVNNNAIISAIEVIPGTASTAEVSSTKAASILKDPGSEEAALQVYPNPNSGAEIFIELDGFEKSGAVELSLIDAAGRVIQLNSVHANEQGAAIAIMTFNKAIPRGLYVIKAQSALTIKSVKLVVE